MIESWFCSAVGTDAVHTILTAINYRPICWRSGVIAMTESELGREILNDDQKVQTSVPNFTIDKTGWDMVLSQQSRDTSAQVLQDCGLQIIAGVQGALKSASDYNQSLLEGAKRGPLESQPRSQQNKSAELAPPPREKGSDGRTPHEKEHNK